LILSVDINVGIVAYWILPGNVNNHIWRVYLETVLFPRINQRQRVLLFDNLSAHLHVDNLTACHTVKLSNYDNILTFVRQGTFH